MNFLSALRFEYSTAGAASLKDEFTQKCKFSRMKFLELHRKTALYCRLIRPIFNPLPL